MESGDLRVVEDLAKSISNVQSPISNLQFAVPFYSHLQSSGPLSVTTAYS